MSYLSIFIICFSLSTPFFSTSKHIDHHSKKIESLQNDKHVIVNKLSTYEYEFPILIDFDENGRNVYEERIQGMFPFINSIKITEKNCTISFNEETDDSGAENALRLITKIFNYESFEIH